MKQMRLYILFLIALAVFTIPFCCTYLTESTIDNSKNEIILRKIGHEVLISSNDRTSRVVPIRTISKNEFQIRFENKFAFAPDSLINIVQNNISNSSFAKEYSVSVQNCDNNAIVYGFHIGSDSSKNVITCIGRKMPYDCYTITLKFISKSAITFTTTFFFLSAIVILLLIFWFLINRKKGKNIEIEDTKSIKIGKYQFYYEKQYIDYENEKIVLTQKESKLLYLFFTSPNEIIDRSILQREVWENEGIIVTRSLDMFISKLRKKLDKDSTITIVNIHGVGYKLEIKS